MWFKTREEAKDFPLVAKEQDSEKEIIHCNRSVGKLFNSKISKFRANLLPETNKLTGRNSFYLYKFQ